MNPLELIEVPMGIINYYYFLAWSRNQEAEKERQEEEKRKKENEKRDKNGKNSNTRIHPAQGGRSFNPHLLEDLQDELE